MKVSKVFSKHTLIAGLCKKWGWYKIPLLITDGTSNYETFLRGT